MNRLEFGNYTLKFGDKKVLLDMYGEVVLPSFFEMKYIRKLGNKGEYFFLDTEVIKLSDDEGDPVVGICGRIVKNTKLRRDQIFRNNTVVSDKDELETAPSSTFLLILNNHRLILNREVAGAPTIENFKSTSEFCLRKSHDEFILKEFETAKQNKEDNPEIKRVTKVQLLQEFPRPRLRITPLTDKQDLATFVGRFELIEKLSIKLLPTNKEEIDNDDFWAEFGRRKELLNSPSTRVEFNNKDEGLTPEQVLQETTSAVGMGNSEIKLTGYDEGGDTINGNNDDFSLSLAFDGQGQTPAELSHIKYQEFLRLAETKKISLPEIAQNVKNKIKLIFDRL